MSKHSKKLVPAKSTAGENDTMPKPFTSSSKGNALHKVSSGFVTKKPTSPNKTVSEKLVQTDHPDVALVTGDEPPPEYWKLLAERTRLENSELKNENDELKKKIQLLEKENETLEEMLQDAKTMAEFIDNLPDEGDKESADEDEESAEEDEESDD